LKTEKKPQKNDEKTNNILQNTTVHKKLKIEQTEPLVTHRGAIKNMDYLWKRGGGG